MKFLCWLIVAESFMQKKIVTIPVSGQSPIEIGTGKDLVLIAGPCAIESRDHSLRMAEMIGKVCDKLGVRWIFKACYDKDCRSSPASFHGVGLEEGLQILADVRDKQGVPVTSDFSNPSWGATRKPKYCRACASTSKSITPMRSLSTKPSVLR